MRLPIQTLFEGLIATLQRAARTTNRSRCEWPQARDRKLERKEICYMETRLLDRYTETGTRVGNNRRYTPRREISAHPRFRPTTPHKPQRENCSYTSGKWQPAYRRAALASKQDITYASITSTHQIIKLYILRRAGRCSEFDCFLMCLGASLGHSVQLRVPVGDLDKLQG